MSGVRVSNGVIDYNVYSDGTYSDFHVNFYHDDDSVPGMPIVTITWDKFDPDELSVIVWDETGNASTVAEHTLSLKDIIKNAECGG